MALRAELVLSGLQPQPDMRAAAAEHDESAPWSRLLSSMLRSLGAGALTQPGPSGWAPAASLDWHPRCKRLAGVPAVPCVTLSAHVLSEPAVVDAQSRIAIYAVVAEGLKLKGTATRCGLKSCDAASWLTQESLSQKSRSSGSHTLASATFLSSRGVQRRRTC